jgi:hypothetical protein
MIWIDRSLTGDGAALISRRICPAARRDAVPHGDTDVDRPPDSRIVLYQNQQLDGRVMAEREDSNSNTGFSNAVSNGSRCFQSSEADKIRYSDATHMQPGIENYCSCFISLLLFNTLLPALTIYLVPGRT